MSYNPNNPNGQATSANSAPVVIASNQSSVPTTTNDPVTGVGGNVALTGQVQTRIDPTEVFNESFEGGVIDVTNRWNAPVLAGSGTVTQSSTLGLVVTVGTTANNAGALSSQFLFPTQYGSPASLAFGFKIEATTIATGNYRFMGYGTQGTSYSTSDPIANGIGIEITTAGVLRAVIYASDVVVFSQNLTVPVDGLEHVVVIQTLGNFTLWFMDTFSVPAATAQLQSPDITLLPLRFASLNGGSTTTGTPALTVYGVSLLDSGRNASQLADGTYPWRRATVSSVGNLAVTEPDITVTGASAQTAVVNNILTTSSGSAATSTVGFRSMSVQVVSTGTAGTFIFEGSNDNVNFQSIPVYSQALLTGISVAAAITATATNLIYIFPVTTEFVRLRIATTITGGSIQAFSRMSPNAWINPTTSVNVAAGTVTTVSTVTSVTAVASVTSSNTAIPGIIADVASAALTTTTTTATLTPTFGSSYQVNIPVTVVSGTTPTLDVQIQESRDTGTNWVAIYDFPRITATGSYNSPVMPFTGNRLRYVQTVTGTTPSFTRAINRLQSSTSVGAIRQIVDRTLNPNTLNSTTASLNAESQTQNITVTFDIAAATVAPVLQIQGSDDGGASWYNVGSTLTGVASSTVSLTVSSVTAQLFRANVSTAGTGVTLTYVLLRAW